LAFLKGTEQVQAAIEQGEGLNLTQGVEVGLGTGEENGESKHEHEPELKSMLSFC
jgi:hypothetical protein